jgi:hypothetical protein
MKTKRVHGVDLHSRCFAHVGDESDPATWQLCIRVLGDPAKTINAVKSSLHRFDAVMMKIPDSAREQTWHRLCGAAMATGIDVAKRSFTRPAAETTAPPATESVKLPAPVAEPEVVRVEPKVTFHKDVQMDAYIAESDRRADEWLRILNLE